MTKLDDCISILEIEIKRANGAGFIRSLTTATANQILRQLKELRDENATLRAERDGKVETVIAKKGSG